MAEDPERLLTRWKIVALAFGPALIGAGLSAYWDTLSPPVRVALVLLWLGACHAAGAAMTERAPKLSMTLHAIGTVALGVGIFLVGHIFNLDDHWPSGLMLWALGALLAWALLRDGPQLALVAILTPVWVISEWMAVTEPFTDLHYAVLRRITDVGQFLLTLSYLSATEPTRRGLARRVLLWIGGVWMLPASLLLAFTLGGIARLPPEWKTPPPANGLLALGWIGAIGLPLLVAIACRRLNAWPNLLAAGWLIALVNLEHFETIATVGPYAWWALGAIGLAAWGVGEGRPERIHLGGAILAAAALLFCFSRG